MVRASTYLPTYILTYQLTYLPTYLPTYLYQYLNTYIPMLGTHFFHFKGQKSASFTISERVSLIYLKVECFDVNSKAFSID